MTVKVAEPPSVTVTLPILAFTVTSDVDVSDVDVSDVDVSDVAESGVNVILTELGSCFDLPPPGSLATPSDTKRVCGNSSLPTLSIPLPVRAEMES